MALKSSRCVYFSPRFSFGCLSSAGNASDIYDLCVCLSSHSMAIVHCFCSVFTHIEASTSEKIEREREEASGNERKKENKSLNV